MNHRTLALSLLLLAAPAVAQPRRPRVLAQRHPTPSTAPAHTAPAHPAPSTVPARPAPSTAPAPSVAAAQPAPSTGPAAPNGALTPDQVAQRIQDFYDRTTDFQADFVQLSRNRLYGEERRAGHVLFRKPGRMRWNYSAPHSDVIVTNGTTLWAYQADERQAVQQTLQQSQLPTAIAFLAGTGRLTDSFTFRLLDANQFRFPDGYVLELRPTTPQPTYERIVFYVDRGSFQVVRTAVIDAQGNQNRFDFSHPQVNMNISEATFSWSPPAGTSIVRP
ncbi:MAG: outer-membrane lipoprotein carrier protein LolA [Polyangiales bacterium]